MLFKWRPGCWESGLLYQVAVILGFETLQFVMRNTLLYSGSPYWSYSRAEIRSRLDASRLELAKPAWIWTWQARQEMYDDIVFAAIPIVSQDSAH